MAFEIFNYQCGKRVDVRKLHPFVSIDNGITIRINKPCLEYLGDADYLLLLFDPEANMVRLKVSEKTPNTYRLTRHKGGSQATINIRSFIKHFDIANQNRIPATLTDNMIQFSIEKQIPQ